MELASYFFDTYALFEIIRGSPDYEVYTKDVSIVTTRLNLMELYYGLFRDNGKKEAEHYFAKIRPYAVDASDFVIKAAMEFRFANREKKLSYVDCLGYTFSRQNHLKFLTGDWQFKDLPGVEYVK